MNRWTDQQLAAIDSRDTNLLVSAAAGSGKTAVLIERIIRMVLHDKIDIDRLLVVTFTRAAAAEMRERAASALSNSIISQPGKESFIRRQLALLNQSSILTFHSFCMQVIKNHYYLINLEPSFRTADQAEAALIQQESVEEVLEQSYLEGNPDFIRLIEMYCGNRNDQAVQDMIIHLYRYSQSQAEPILWLDEQAKIFDVDAENLKISDWLFTLLDLAEVKLEHVYGLLYQALELSTSLDGPEVYRKCLKMEMDEISALQELCKQKNTDAVDQIRNFTFDKLPSCRCTDPDLREDAKKYRKQAKDEIKKMQDSWFFRSIEGYAADHQEIAPNIRSLIETVKLFDIVYEKKKRERNVLDFNDLEHMALRILQFPEASQHYRQQYEAILIDEYQDSNRVQEALIHYIRRSDNVFMVGDVKQSIYRFRLAEPELFMQKYVRFAENRNNEKRIDLNRNFRSRKTILDAVNYIFQQIMSTKVGEILYDESVYLQYGDTYPRSIAEEPVSVHLLEKNMTDGREDGDDEESDAKLLLEEWTDQEAEAMLLAQQINELRKKDIVDVQRGCTRPIKYGDITVLLRAPGNQSPRFTEILTQQGIPVYADQGTGLYDTIEIQLFINLLRIIDNYRQDMPLLSVLRSQFGGFTTEELATIRLTQTAKYFHESLVGIAHQDTPTGLKANRFFARLKKWRQKLRMLPLTEFLWWLLSDSGFYAVSAAMPGGRQRQANLRILLNRAADFSSRNDGGLFALLSYIDKLKFSPSNDHGSAKTLSENDDVVRMMSIHKSKGLEFPVVIVAGLGKKFNYKDNQMPVLMHKTLGIGPRFADPEKRIKRDTLARVAIREKSRIESLSEEMRILYVGLTRAQQKLILIGAVSNLPLKVKQWNQPINSGRMAAAQSMLDWLGPAWVRVPDAAELRMAGITQTESFPDTNGWQFSIWNKRSLMIEEVRKEDQETSLREVLHNHPNPGYSPVSQLFDQRLLWQYPHRTETEMPGKVSVTELLRDQELSGLLKKPNIPDLILTPRFMENKSLLTAAEKGVAFHYFLQHLDLDKVGSLKEIEHQLVSMQSSDMLTEQEAKSIDLLAVSRFFDCDTGKRMLKAEKLYRELPFVMKKSETESVMIQGVMDCCFLEDGEWVLIDFKTDAVEQQEAVEWSHRYRMQLLYYKTALEMMTKITVKEMMIYSFHLHEVFPIKIKESGDYNETGHI